MHGIKHYKELFFQLETIEQKSFWLVAPIVVIIGLLSAITTSKAYSSVLSFLSAGLCVIVPVIMMLICKKTKRYNIDYPIFVILVSSICIPVTFLANGGFDSGMPILCMAATVLCAFCYNRRWRYISLSVAVLSNLVVFYISKGGFETLYPVEDSWIENDIIFSYCVGTLGLYFIINMILDEARNYVTGTEVLSTFVDKRVGKELIAKVTSGNTITDGVRRKVTVLFADISRFTSTTEMMTPETAAQYLNVFLQISDEAVHENNGIVDKFIGDCVMAYWIDPKEDGSGVLSAIKCVMDIKQKLYDIQPEIHSRFGTEMDFSSGIEYGNVVLGNIGSKERKDYTIIGDTVNTASRIQGKAGRGELLISDTAAKLVENRVDMVGLSEGIYLKGKNNETTLYHINGILDTTKSTEHTNKQKKTKSEAGAESSIFNFYVMGCRGSFPISGIRFSEFGGETSCYVLKKNKHAVVIDCGTGLGNAAELLSDCEKIDILLTHVHYDHIMGLLNMSVFPRDIPIRMFGHFGSWAGRDTITGFLDTPYWPVNVTNMEFIDVTIGAECSISEEVQATFYRADHPNNGCVIKIMAGDQKVCIFADMENHQYLNPDIAMDCDLLLYDGMFDDKEREAVRGRGHSTWQEGVRYAMSEHVKRLVITHHNPKCGDRELRKLEEEAKRMFPQAVFARTGDVFLLK